MKQQRTLRFGIIAVVLILGVSWALASVGAPAAAGYPNGRFLVTAQWLQQHANDPNLVIVDVREDKYLGDVFIPGAVHLEWKQFQETDTARGIGGAFIGIDRSQEILGRAGVTRTDTVVLYDNLKRDGAATSSYVFWVLDLLGHTDMKVLERGIEAWTDAGYETVRAPRVAAPVLYQASLGELRLDRQVDGTFVQSRLGDRFYQILDVRSADEYAGQAANKGLDGGPLKLGHAPTAVNVDYTLNWTDPESKDIKSYAALQALYAGLDPNRGVITYCHSGRRGSFSYFVLRLMGFEQVALYDASWFEWGNNRLFFPVETKTNTLVGALPGASVPAGGGGSTPAQPRAENRPKTTGGYISCGG
ncbi:MAG: sulfurtransferase [Desulfobacterales bacterium]|nr:sulfurtransferase [Desulfobacterales bacterium]